MAAFAKCEFKHGFLLDQDRLVYINKMLGKALKEFPAPKSLVFKVYLEDFSYYTTEDLGVVLEEKNFRSKRIEQIAIQANAEMLLNVEIDFTLAGIKLRTEGTDRDTVLPLYYELREFLSNGVATGVHVPRWADVLLTIMSLVTISICFLLILSRLMHPSEQINQLLNSIDLNEKLNYIIAKDKPYAEKIYVYLTLMMLSVAYLVLSLVFNLNRRASQFIVPRNVFLFGREIERHSNVLRKRARLFWQILIPVVIGLATSYAIWVVTRIR